MIAGQRKYDRETTTLRLRFIFEIAAEGPHKSA
jgi:hypothetical protein